MTLSKGAARAAALLDAAEQVLTTQGNANSAMRDFAAAAGVRVGHLQHYYPTRADLIRAVMSRALTRSLDRLAVVPDTDQSLSREESEHFIGVLLGEQDDQATVRLYVGGGGPRGRGRAWGLLGPVHRTRRGGGRVGTTGAGCD